MANNNTTYTSTCYASLDKYKHIESSLAEIGRFEEMSDVMNDVNDRITRLKNENYFENKEYAEAILKNKYGEMSEIIIKSGGQNSTLSNTVEFYRSYDSIIKQEKLLMGCGNYED